MQNLLKKYRLSASKKLGQNFLIDKGVIKKVIGAAHLKTKDIILEIGPGLGALTKELAKKVKKVVAVEKDPNLARILNNELRIKNIKNVKIIQGDILKILNSTRASFQRAGLPNPYSRAAAKTIIHNSYKVVGNLPFYLTAPVIRKFLESNPTAGGSPKEMILIVQKEVGQRICARPPAMSLLSTSIQFYAKPEIIFYISKKSFWPQPGVDSALIKIFPCLNKNTMVERLRLKDVFFEVVKAGFSQPRKQLINNLSKDLKINREKVKNWLLKNNIQPSRRAETLAVEDWLSLTKSCKISQRG
jgi:16S rRNA (adenine1518-N6/adenine1519-N6)-dimethyltransferase